MARAKRVLVTGVYGLVGNVAYRKLRESPEAYDVYGLARRQHPSDRLPESDLCVLADDKLFVANLTDMAAMQKAVQGMDVVVHMAANPNGDAPWESILSDNIVGTYNVFEACRLAGVERIVSASSVQTVHGYWLQEPYQSLIEGRLDDISAEALAHVYAYRHHMSCVCLRIGGVVAEEPPPVNVARTQWCSRRDIAQIIERCINAPASLRFDVFFGLSDSDRNFADIQHTRDVLGYEPQDGCRVSDAGSTVSVWQ